MNTKAIQLFKGKLEADEAVTGLWITLESPSITEMAVGLGLDWVVIDAEHGHLDFKEIMEHCRAGVRSNTVVLVRISALDKSLIKRILDVGADGVVIPWIETAEQLQSAVSYACYPPKGVRGIGAERATAWCEGIPQHVSESNDHVLVVPLLESETAGKNIQELLAVDGVHTFFFGPHDWAGTVGAAGEWGGGAAHRQIAETVKAVRAANKHCGVVALGAENIKERINQGFRMIAIGIDGLLMLRSLHEGLKALDRDRTINASLYVDAQQVVQDT